MHFAPDIYGGHNFGHRDDQEDVHIYRYARNILDHLNGFILTKVQKSLERGFSSDVVG